MPRYKTGIHRHDPELDLDILLSYGCNLRRHARRLGLPNARLVEALSPLLAALEGSGVDELDFEGENVSLKEADRRLRAAVVAQRPASPSLLQRQIDRVADFFALDADIACLFGLVVRLSLCEHTQAMWKACFRFKDPSLQPNSLSWMAAVAGVPWSSTEALTPGGALTRSGLCALESDGDLGLPSALRRFFRCNRSLKANLTEHLIGSTKTACLQWEDYDHLGVERELLFRLLSSTQTLAHGAHILLYGPPGTGKTEFAKTLAQQTGRQLVALGEVDEDGEEPERSERLTALRRAATMLRGRSTQALLMVDEAEDVLSTTEMAHFLGLRLRRDGGSKVYLHRLLEEFPVPVVWIVNDLGQLSETVIRRMLFAMAIKPPPASVRKRIWSKALGGAGIEVAETDAEILARDFPSAPAIIDTAARAARYAGGDLEDVRVVAASLLRAVNGGFAVQPQLRSSSVVFEPALANVDHKALATVDKLVRSPGSKPAFSLCLYGPPGTGKSAYASDLASRLGLEVVQKRASDLLDPWVGGTERRIADAFEEAREARALLIFDEADSLLRSRELSRASWEVSQVNEMLTWMESHPLPFVCTTNLLETLDAASLRRFTFKLRFDYLRLEQSRIAFTHFFGRPPPAGLNQLDRLTPSDFALVEKRARLGGFLHDDNALLDLLVGEMALKPDFRRPVGFVVKQEQMS